MNVYFQQTRNDLFNNDDALLSFIFRIWKFNNEF